MRAERVASNRSSRVAATRLWEPSGSVTEMPSAQADSATRSVMRPCARNHGATTSRRAPRRRRRSAASATDGCGPVANATPTPAHWVPARSASATVAVRGVGGVVRRTHRHHDHSEVAVAGRHTRLGQALPEHGDQCGILAKDVGLTHTCARRLDHRRDVDRRVVRARPTASARRWPSRAALRRRSARHTRSGPDCSRNAGRTSSDGRSLRIRPASACVTAADARIDAAVRGQDQRRAGVQRPAAHDACSPHSVFD